MWGKCGSAEIGQNQLVLVKILVNPKVGQDKIKIVQNRIMDLEKERSKLWLDTLDEGAVKSTLGVVLKHASDQERAAAELRLN